MSDTIFHKIINKEIPANILHEDELCIAIRDLNPVSSTHVLIIPKKTIPTLRDVKSEDKEVLGHLICVAGEIAKKENISNDGYRLVINCGANGGQTVFQLHMHLLGGRSFAWPPG